MSNWSKSDDLPEDDFDYSRRTYYDLIEKGNSALEDMIEVARALEHPRAFEVVSGMIKNVSDVNDKLMDLHKKKKEFEKKDVVAQVADNTTNNVFIGSTSDLQRMLLQHDEDKVVDISNYTKDE